MEMNWESPKVNPEMLQTLINKVPLKRQKTPVPSETISLQNQSQCTSTTNLDAHPHLTLLNVTKPSPQLDKHAYGNSESVPTCEKGNNLDSSMYNDFINKLKSIERDEDFTSLMKSVVSGHLPLTNIALHLLLDVGQMMRDGRRLEYNYVTKQFWLAIHILLKAKNTRLCRGNLSFNADETENGMNFGVPSEKTMEHQIQIFKHEVSEPEVISNMLKQFQRQNCSNRSSKICIDGKKLAIGICDNLGEEDLNSLEQNLTLQQRKEWLDAELHNLECLQQAVEDESDIEKIKNLAFDALTTISRQLQEMKTGKLVTERKLEKWKKSWVQMKIG